MRDDVMHGFMEFLEELLPYRTGRNRKEAEDRRREWLKRLPVSHSPRPEILQGDGPTVSKRPAQAPKLRLVVPYDHDSKAGERGRVK